MHLMMMSLAAKNTAGACEAQSGKWDRRVSWARNSPEKLWHNRPGHIGKIVASRGLGLAMKWSLRIRSSPKSRTRAASNWPRSMKFRAAPIHHGLYADDRRDARHHRRGGFAKMKNGVDHRPAGRRAVRRTGAL